MSSGARSERVWAGMEGSVWMEREGPAARRSAERSHGGALRAEAVVWRVREEAGWLMSR